MKRQSLNILVNRMKHRIVKCLSFIFLLSWLAACNAPTSSPQELAVPPTPFPDTPSPIAIDAPLIESPSLVKIRFLNELDGWGVTDTQIVRTNDGGITWYNVTPPNLTETGYGVELFALDNLHVWIQKADFDNYPNGGFLYRTFDGGITWMTVNTPFSDGHLSFLDEKNGWMLADLGVGAGSNAVAVYQTIDGGAAWNLKFINDPNHAGASDTLPLGGLKSGLTPSNMQTAWVSGVVYSDGTVYFFRTDDGGSNWSQVTGLELPPDALKTQVGFDPIQFVSAHDAFLTVHIPSDQNQMAIYVSRDAGETWSLTPTLIPNGIAADFLSATDAIIYNREQFYVTHDAAHTWTLVPPDIDFGEIFIGMDFLNTSAGFVITQDANNHRSLYRTDNGGATWFPVIP